MITVNQCRIALQNTGLRAGPEASKELKQQIDETTELIAENAAKIAKHSGRQTITIDDIRLAVEILEE